MLLYENRHFRVEAISDRLVRVVRLGNAFVSQSDASDACGPVVEVLHSFGRENRCLLIDSREAVPNNDPEYEGWYAPCRAGITQGFLAVAVLMRTRIGELQSRRLITSDRPLGGFRTFTEEEDAVEFLERQLGSG